MLKGLDRALAAAHDLARRAVVEPLDELEYDDLSLLVGQVLEGNLELASLDSAFGQRLRNSRRSSQLSESFLSICRDIGRSVIFFLRSDG